MKRIVTDISLTTQKIREKTPRDFRDRSTLSSKSLNQTNAERRVFLYIKILDGGGVETVNVNQGHDSHLGIARSDAIGPALDTVYMFGQRSEGPLLFPSRLGRRGVATGIGYLDIHCESRDA